MKETIVYCTKNACLNNYNGFCTAIKIKLKGGKCVDCITANNAMKKKLKA